MFSDDQIRKDIFRQLAADHRFDTSKITVDVRDGIATLSGNVPSTSALTAALSAAAVVAGGTNIIDDLKVRATGESETPDARLKVTVAELLAHNPDIDPSRIMVMVQQGTVTLEGSVDVDWKKEYVEQLVAVTKGVRNVVSNLTVVPTKGVADQTTADSINAALQKHALIDDENVTVRVEDGKVTLSGKVSGPTARQIARRAASYSLGVTDVLDELELEPE